MYSVQLTDSAKKDLKNLPKQMQERIVAALERTRIRPEAHYERLVGEEVYKLRVGDYRIIADIQYGKLTILIIEVGHRKNIYKKQKNWQKKS